MKDRRAIGKLGEGKAIDFLECQGYQTTGKELQERQG